MGKSYCYHSSCWNSGAEDNFPNTTGGTWNCLGTTRSTFLLTAAKRAHSLCSPFSWAVPIRGHWTRSPFGPGSSSLFGSPSIIKYHLCWQGLSYVKKSASQQETSTHLHCISALKALEIPLHQWPTEPWLGLLAQGLQEEMHSYATADWFPCHLHRPLGKRREAADTCVQSVVPDLSSSHREEIAELVTSPFLPHLLRSFDITASKSITSILKRHLHDDRRTLFMCWGNR